SDVWLRGQNVLVCEDPTAAEIEPNDDPEKPQPLTLPIAVSGRFDRPRDVDVYQIEPPANGSYSIEVYCERIAGRADPFGTVTDEQGNLVTELDDYGIR